MTSAISSTPTVALVHGAFADSGSWNGVTDLLLAAGVPVQAVSNPLRGIASDAAYVASAIRQIPGPVLAVGHSYGGGGLPNGPPPAGHRLGVGDGGPPPPAQGGRLPPPENRSTHHGPDHAPAPRPHPAGAGPG